MYLTCQSAHVSKDCCQCYAENDRIPSIRADTISCAEIAAVAIAAGLGEPQRTGTLHGSLYTTEPAVGTAERNISLQCLPEPTTPDQIREVCSEPSFAEHARSCGQRLATVVADLCPVHSRLHPYTVADHGDIEGSIFFPFELRAPERGTAAELANLCAASEGVRGPGAPFTIFTPACKFVCGQALARCQ